MMLKFFLLACMLHLAIAAPQLLTFRDGKFGVNFGGYHAEAGLGGLLTGNAAHGGLSASAGTPSGQKAGAGLGGSVDGNAAGLLYAGAEANPQTGAGAILGGDTRKGGYAGSVAYAPRKTVASINQQILPANPGGQVNTVTSGPSYANDATSSRETSYNGIQKIRPPKKYLIKPSTLSSSKDKNHNNSDRKTTATHQTRSADDLNRANDISTVVSATKIANHNGNSNIYDGGAAIVAASTTVKQRKYAGKTIATHVADVQQPAATTSIATVASGTPNNAEHHVTSQRSDEVPQPVVGAQVEYTAPANLDAVLPTTIVVSTQRLRQKSRIRPHRQLKRERQQHRQRERERLVQTQRAHWTESEAVGAADEAATTSQTKNQQSDVIHTQYAAQVNAHANAHANTNTNTKSNPDGYVAYSKHLSKRVENQNFDSSAPSPLPQLNLNVGPSVVTSALNIPIGILRSLQESLGGLGAAKQGSFATYH